MKGNKRGSSELMQDPAMPMIQLPTRFKSRRTNTATQQRTSPEPYHVDILNVEGAGCVRHIWFLFAEGRRIEITVDGAPIPQVNMPLKSFFGVMHNWTPYFTDNAALTVLPNYETPNMVGNPGYNLWLPIPFSKSCRIRVYVDNPPNGKLEGLQGSVCTVVDWHEYDLDTEITPFRFHAEHHLHTPAPPRNSSIQIAEVDGTGFLAAVMLGVKQRNYSDMIYHTGGMTMLLDGEYDPHVIRGTNMEDDFGFSWGFHIKNSRWIGSPYHKWGGRHDQDGAIYRIFGPDAISFDTSLSFSCGSRDDDTETVAFYYKIPGTEQQPLSKPLQWRVSGLYDGGSDETIFDKSEEIERVPVQEWADYYRDNVGFIRNINSPRGWIDWRFSGISPDTHSSNFTGKSMYAGTVIERSSNETTNLRLYYDDWISCWLNGVKLGTWKSVGIFDSVYIPIKLQKGENNLMLKSNNIGHHWNPWISSAVVES